MTEVNQVAALPAVQPPATRRPETSQRGKPALASLRQRLATARSLERMGLQFLREEAPDFAGTVSHCSRQEREVGALITKLCAEVVTLHRQTLRLEGILARRRPTEQADADRKLSRAELLADLSAAVTAVDECQLWLAITRATRTSATQRLSTALEDAGQDGMGESHPAAQCCTSLDAVLTATKGTLTRLRTRAGGPSAR